MKQVVLILFVATALSVQGAVVGLQTSSGMSQVPAELTETGNIIVAGQTVPYLIRRLPVNSFPKLPEPVADILNQRGCMIPQTYQAHRPENVVHASLERSGSADFAVLCSARGTVTLLVFFGSAPENPVELASSPEKECLETHDASGVLGFDWGIDPASPRQVREAQAAMKPRPAMLDHDALADTILEKSTVYHFYFSASRAWTRVEMPE
jgi:hypothetical protein